MLALPSAAQKGGEAMTEAEWLASVESAAMLNHLLLLSDDNALVFRPGTTDRKLRLFACACCRQVWDVVECETCRGEWMVVWCKFCRNTSVLVFDEPRDEEACPFCSFKAGEQLMAEVAQCPNCLGTRHVGGGLTDPRSRRAIEVAELYADGMATEEERIKSYRQALDVPPICEESFAEASVWDAAETCAKIALAAACGIAREPYSCPVATQTALLRCIFGNPWRLVEDRWVWFGDFMPTPAVLDLARAIYDERRWGELGVLADALEEAGLPADEPCRRCEHKPRGVRHPSGGWMTCECGGAPYRVQNPILTHLRSPGPHARGCWAVDLVLGKE